MNEHENNVYSPDFLQAVGIATDALFFSLGNPSDDLPFKKPYALMVYDEVKKVKTWSALIVEMASYVYRNMPQIIYQYKDTFPHPFRIIKNRFAISGVATQYIQPREFVKGCWIETNYSSQDCVRFICEMATVAGLDKDRIIVFYGEKRCDLSCHQEPIAHNPAEEPDDKELPTRLNSMTVKQAAVTILEEANEPLTASEILRRIQEKNLYQFNSNNPLLILYQTIRRACKGVDSPNHTQEDVFERFTDESGQVRYMLLEQEYAGNAQVIAEEQPPDPRWLPILQDSFPDGYILRDFLCQFQASAFWQERYGDSCPIEGVAIDHAMQTVGIVRDNRVFPKSEKDQQLIASICEEVDALLTQYTNVYRSCVYERYREQLAVCSIYTEAVMTQQVLAVANSRFYSTGSIFARRGKETSVVQDCRTVLRTRGGAMRVDEIAKILWFIPADYIYHCLSVQVEALNLGNSTWMLAEHFPLTSEDVQKIGDMLDEYFLTNSFVQAVDLPSLIQQRLPSIADNLSSMTYMAVFNVVQYYLKNRFSFSLAIVSPKGASMDFTDLFKSFGAEHKTFTLADLEAFANELRLPIYWEATYASGAVRVSQTEFVHRDMIQFDVDAIDQVLEVFCPGDYLPFLEVSSAMMMHLPSCGYRWNGYLLLCYVREFSKVFRAFYNSLGKTGFYGAMVRRSCKEIDNYGSLIERILTDDDTWTTSADALDLLVKRGYQVRRKYKGIDTIVEKARQNKQFTLDGR